MNLNLFLWRNKFKYEDIRMALSYFQKQDFLCTFDLKSGYHHVDIHKDSQTYLGFEWEGKHYVFTVLPFGLAIHELFISIASHAHTKNVINSFYFYDR